MHPGSTKLQCTAFLCKCLSLAVGKKTNKWLVLSLRAKKTKVKHQNFKFRGRNNKRDAERFLEQAEASVPNLVLILLEHGTLIL